MAEHLFCPRSGNLAELNTEKHVIECTSSGYERSLQELSAVRIRTKVDMEDFFRRHEITPLVQSGNLDAGKRVLQRDDHVQCTECKHTGVDFYTKQLRSADEGQTVFYECPNCGNKWKENS
eukprot:jgi/Ulvmu1/4758/UM020_0043.1